MDIRHERRTDIDVAATASATVSAPDPEPGRPPSLFPQHLSFALYSLSLSSLHSFIVGFDVAKTASQASPPVSPSSSPAFALPPLPSSSSPPQQAPYRRSLTNRIFTRRFYNSANSTPAPPRLSSARLWNPINSSPRDLPPPLPNLRVDHPQLVEGAPIHTEGRDEYPLLTLPEQLNSRQSVARSSLVVEPSPGLESGRTSIGFPRSPTLPKAPPMEQLAAAAGIKGVGTPEPLTNVRHGTDLETGEPKHMNRISSKASVPLDRRNSFLSQQGGEGTQDGTDGQEEEADDEFAWGPSHPCFPHQNAHVPLDSPLYSSTRIIRVKRDWMVAGDLAPTFANLYPEVLDPLVSEETFRSVVNKINSELMAAFSPWRGRAVLDAILGAATLWLWDDLGFTGVKTRLRKLEQWIEEWNRKIGEPEGVKIIELRRTGYLTLDFQIPDPQIGIEPQQTNNRQSIQPPAPAVLPSDQGHGPGPGVYEYQPTHNFATQHLPPMPQAVA